MAGITDYKVSTAEVNSVHIVGIEGDTLTGTSAQNKAVFDAYPDLIKNKHNGLVDYVNDNYSESNIDVLVTTYYRDVLGWRNT